MQSTPKGGARQGVTGPHLPQEQTPGPHQRPDHGAAPSLGGCASHDSPQSLLQSCSCTDNAQTAHRECTDNDARTRAGHSCTALSTATTMKTHAQTGSQSVRSRNRHSSQRDTQTQRNQVSDKWANMHHCRRVGWGSQSGCKEAAFIFGLDGNINSFDEVHVQHSALQESDGF